MKSPSIISQLLLKIQKQRVIYVFDCSVSGEVLKSTVKFRKEVLGSSGVELDPLQEAIPIQISQSPVTLLCRGFIFNFV